MAVVHGLGFAYLPEAVVDGFGEVTAEGESSFAGGGGGCDEEEEVGEYFPVGVYAAD